MSKKLTQVSGSVTHNIKSEINNLHTSRNSVEWSAGLKIDDELQLVSHSGVTYLPDSKQVPFTTSATWDADMAASRFSEESLVTLHKMRSDSASQLGLVYFSDWTTGLVVPNGAMTAKLAVWHDGQFYSIGTDTGFTSNDFDADLGKGWFVSDKAITVQNEIKLRSENATIALSSMINPNSLADQRSEIQSAFNYAAANKKKLIVDCVAWCNAETINDVHTHIKVPANLTAEWLEGASINSIDTAANGYNMLEVTEDNIHLIKPKLVGDKEIHTGTTGEWGYGIWISCGAKNVLIEYPDISDMWGDGIYIGYSFSAAHVTKGYPVGVKIIKPVISNARRNGISLCCGEDILIDTPKIKNVLGAFPQAGIDIEPESPDGHPRILKATIVNPTISACGAGMINYALHNNSNVMSIDVDITGKTTIIDCGEPIVAKGMGTAYGSVNYDKIDLYLGDAGNTSIQLFLTTETNFKFNAKEVNYHFSQSNSRNKDILMMGEDAKGYALSNVNIEKIRANTNISLTNYATNFSGFEKFTISSDLPIIPYNLSVDTLQMSNTVHITPASAYQLTHNSIETDEILPQFVAGGVPTDPSITDDLYITRPQNDNRDFVITKRFDSKNKLYYRNTGDQKCSYAGVLTGKVLIANAGQKYHIKSVNVNGVGDVDFVWN